MRDVQRPGTAGGRRRVAGSGWLGWLADASRLGGPLVAATLLATSPVAGETPKRVRGSVVAIDGGGIKVQQRTGGVIHLSTNVGTAYADVVPSSLEAIEAGSYIGSAVKGPPDRLVAVEIVLVPPSMQAGRVGFYPWDVLPDTSGPDPRAVTSTAMTNGIVRAIVAGRADRTFLVDLVGGRTAHIEVGSRAPVVRFVPSERSALSVGSVVVVWTGPGNGARLIAVGKGVSPPM